MPAADPAGACDDDIAAHLEGLRDRGLSRRLRMVDGAQGPTVSLDGAPVLLLCSNNYLGLADHPAVREAAARAALEHGVGAGSSRLVSGTMAPHRQLERELAAFKGTREALLFGSGYLANIGVLGALAGVAPAGGCTVFSDALNHASIIDGCRLARADTFIYDHGDAEHLAWGLAEHGIGTGRAGIIVTDSVFSMDGDVAPLEAIVALARRHGARTVVDEAHGTGAVGPGGRGLVAELGLSGEIDVIVGTLGKALGSYGAFAASSPAVRDLLINTARPFIFSTALPIPVVAAAAAALEVLVSDPGLPLRLQRAATVLRDALTAQGLDVGASSTQIIPLIIGDAEQAMAICERALAQGVFAQAIRPPTVPAGTSRLRLAVMATHTDAELAQAARTLARAAAVVPAA